MDTIKKIHVWKLQLNIKQQIKTNKNKNQNRLKGD